MTTDDSEEVVDLGDLPHYWDLYEQKYRRVRNLPAPDATTLTARRFDESQVAGHRAYMGAVRYLGVAHDNHHALRGLLTHFGAGPSAPWSLLRPMFESGFLGCWILDPIDGADRRARGLRAEVNDERERKNHLLAFADVPDFGVAVAEAVQARDADVGRTYRSEAEQLGIPWPKISQRIKVVDDLPSLRFLAAQDAASRAFMIGTWRLLSGLEHGLAYAMLRSTDAAAEVKVPGGVELRITINDAAFVTAAKACLWLNFEALARLERLHTRAP